MSNWDLMMPGMGLTAIGLAGVFISYAGLAHTFIDGMHALTGLTMFIGLIFLSTGILDGGISTSNRAKATTLVIISIVLAFAVVGFTLGTFDSNSIFAGVMLALVTPAIVMEYIAAKMPPFLRPVGSIFALAAGAGILTFVGFGMVGPAPYLLPEPEEIVVELEPEIPEDAQVFTVSMLAGSSIEGNPDYDPDSITVMQGDVVAWVNEDVDAHTASSLLDAGDTFDTGLLGAGEVYNLDTSNIQPGTYEYYCLVHPWMDSVLVIEGEEIIGVSIPVGSSNQQPGQLYYDPDLITVSVGDTVTWFNDDDQLHTVTEVNNEYDSSLMSPGDTFEYTFTQEGTSDYYCIVHPWMVGTVIVE